MVLHTETLRFSTILRNTIFIDQNETDGQFEAVDGDVHGLRLDDTNTPRRPETRSSSCRSLLLCWLVFLWAGVRGERSSRLSCAKMAAKLASKMLNPDLTCHRCPPVPPLRGGFSMYSRDTHHAMWLAVSRLKESSTQVPTDASLCSLRPGYGGLEVLRIDSDHMQASSFDVLR